jgi:hypothetical protein
VRLIFSLFLILLLLTLVSPPATMQILPFGQSPVSSILV